MKAKEYGYIALIRAVNVLGRTVIKMSRIRRIFESLGFKNVSTYIQTGNVLFTTTETNRLKLERMIESKLKGLIGDKPKVFILTRDELMRAAKGNALDRGPQDRTQRCHLVFLSAAPTAARRKALMAVRGKEYRFHVRGKMLYYAYDNKYAGNRRTIDFEKILGVVGTARNVAVIRALIELSRRFP